MKNYYTIKITILNDIGELINKDFSFTTLDEMSNEMGDKMFGVVDEAKDYAKKENMYLEELV